MDGYAWGCLDDIEKQQEQHFEEPEGRIYGRGHSSDYRRPARDAEASSHVSDEKGGEVRYGR